MNANAAKEGPTPAEIAQAKAILEQAEASRNTSTDTTAVHVVADQPAQNETHHPGEPAASASGADQEDVVGKIVIDVQRKQKIETLFAASINDPRFWSNLKRLDRLEDALKVPLFDDRSMQQFAISAKDELKSLALDIALNNNTVPIMPTEAEITALAEAKYAAKQLKDAAKAAKTPKAKAA